MTEKQAKISIIIVCILIFILLLIGLLTAESSEIIGPIQ